MGGGHRKHTAVATSIHPLILSSVCATMGILDSDKVAFAPEQLNEESVEALSSIATVCPCRASFNPQPCCC